MDLVTLLSYLVNLFVTQSIIMLFSQLRMAHPALSHAATHLTSLHLNTM